MIIASGWALRALLVKDKSITPNFWGKAADSCQAILVFVFLLNIHTRFFYYGAILTVFFTIFSGISYIKIGINSFRCIDYKSKN